MLSDSLGEEDPLRDHVLTQFICLQCHVRISRKRKSNIAICERWVKSAGESKKNYGSLREAPDRCSRLRSGYLPAPTDATWMVSPFSVPVTVVEEPAALSRLARVALSLVSSV